MRINQGVVLIIGSICGIILYHFLGMGSWNSVFFFIIGVSLMRLDKYWEIRK